jgi:hypothetical protein
MLIRRIKTFKEVGESNQSTLKPLDLVRETVVSKKFISAKPIFSSGKAIMKPFLKQKSDLYGNDWTVGPASTRKMIIEIDIPVFCQNITLG